MSVRTFYQSHQCEGFRAKVVIEWSEPSDDDLEFQPAWRAADAEEIADEILAFSGPRMRDMVQAMRGFKPRDSTPSVTPTEGGA
jgi:hypothetical protein